MTKIILEINEQWLRKEEWEIEHKLAHLILEDVIFCNNGWWYKDEGIIWREGYISHHVNCNDIFSWGSADAEDVTYKEITDLYEMWKKDPIWGAAAWCIQKRKCKPQAPVEKNMILAGYNIEELINEKK